ncbi:MAG: hypothetical protein ABIN89_11060 [Chitinophagaceae bacterium]
MKNEKDDLRQFAMQRLNVHNSELATRYNNAPLDKDVMREAHSTHRNLFDEELRDKINDLLEPGNQVMKEQLEDIKQLYLDKL